MVTKKWEWVLRNLRFNLRFSGWLPAAAGALGVGGFLTFYNNSHAETIYLRRIIELVIPLAFGLPAAFVPAPENVPAIELLLSYPKPMTRLLREWLRSISLLHGGSALPAQPSGKQSMPDRCCRTPAGLRGGNGYAERCLSVDHLLSPLLHPRVSAYCAG